MRLLLAALVLGVPTVLMGGTLPAAARAQARGERRRPPRLLYGANTLGAVPARAGHLLPARAARHRCTLWRRACSTRRRRRARPRPGAALAPPTGAPEARDPARRRAAGPRRFVLAAAALVGFVFFLMELVWYRMLARCSAARSTPSA